MGMIMHDDVPYGEGTSYTPGTGIAINNNIIAVDADNAPTENSEKPVKSKGVYSALESSESTQESLLKSTVGWTGKNKFNYNAFKAVIISGGTAVFENNGITLTATSNDCHTANNVSKGYPIDAIIPVEEGKPIKLIWKSTETVYAGDVYVFPNGEQAGMINVGNEKNIINYTPVSGVTFITVRFGVSISGNTVHYKDIMVMDASIADDTYEPYHESVEEEIEQIYADNGVLGAKNLLENKATTQTVNGITYTVNSDGSITANGTATASADLIINQGFQITEKCILSGCPVNGSSSTYRLMYTSWGAPNVEYADTGDGIEINNIPIETSPNVRVVFRVSNGQTVNNITIKPMVRLASDPDDTYQPYAMTNKELTEELTVQESAVTDIISDATVVRNHLYKYGKVVQLDLTITGVTAKADTSIARIPEGFRPKGIAELNAPSNLKIYITHDGKVMPRQNMNNNTCLGTATWITD